MAKSKYELIVVGAGVVGMGIALAAHKKGVKKILVIDQLLKFFLPLFCVRLKQCPYQRHPLPQQLIHI